MVERIKTTLDNVFSLEPTGSIESAITESSHGINHRMTPYPAPNNQPSQGLVFFTRPQLNFTDENLAHDRRFIPLLTSDDTSWARYIRCMLDPRLSQNPLKNVHYSCPRVDDQLAFIPLLTNHLVNLAGFPDKGADVYEGKRGLYKQQLAFIDGTTHVYWTYDITATFRNIRGNPITHLFDKWIDYASLVFDGTFTPYPDFLIRNEIDYCTRIWRLMLDKNKRSLDGIACTGASFPTGIGIGSHFDFDINKPISESSDNISIQFKSIGACINDPILPFEFNKAVEIFNPNMRDQHRSLTMVQIPFDLIDHFNRKGYPRINTDNGDVEWWIHKQYYASRMSDIVSHYTELSPV